MGKTLRKGCKSGTVLQITCIYKLRHNWSYINPVSANGGVFGFSGGLRRLCGRNRSRFGVIGLFCKLNLVPAADPRPCLRLFMSVTRMITRFPSALAARVMVSRVTDTF